MSLVDEHGRVFGRFNLLDLALASVLLGLIPLGYGAYVLFRVPPPQLTSVEPATLQLDREMRFIVHGQNLRPYMRVSLDDNQTRGFLFKDPTTAEVTFADIPPGQYDVVLYDFAQERSRLPKAFTIAAAALPATTVHAAGFLTGVKRASVATYRVGYDFPTAAQILAVGPPADDLARIVTGDHSVEIPVDQTVRLPVLLRVICSVQQNSAGLGECRSTTGPAVGPGVYLTLPGYEGRIPFLITDVQPPTAPTMIDVRIRVAPEDDAIALAKVGDLDLGAAQNIFAAGASVVVAPTAASRVMTIRVPAFPSLSGWQYGGQILRVGAGINFFTPRYVLTGTVTAVPGLPTPTTP